MVNESTRDQVKRALMEGVLSANAEENEGKGWTISWKSSLATYEMYFKQVLGSYGTFNRLLEERRKRGQPIVVLDLLSTTTALHDIDGLTAGLAVGFGDGRNVEEQKKDANSRIDYIAGNILERKTWNKITDWLADKQSSGFNLMMARPDMPRLFSLFLTNSPVVYASLLTRAYGLLDKDNGTLCIEVPRTIHKVTSRQAFTNWLELLNKNDIETVYDPEHALLLQRSLSSPNSLPKIST